jgi:nucleoside-diphosphate-sugar epimerase
MRILLTGASGCIGHYMAEALIEQTDHELYLFVRNPKKLQFNWQTRSNIHIIQGDLLSLDPLKDLLPTIEIAILAATAWGGDDTFAINVTQTHALMHALNPAVCRQVLYFSTASILGCENQLLQEAGTLGTDYIRSKYECYQQLSERGIGKDSSESIIPRITVLFPTLVFGGEDGNKPLSHLSGGVREVVRWIGLARFLKAEGSFHMTHGQDIAQVVMHLIDHPLVGKTLADRHCVLGSPIITVNQAISEICAYLKTPIYFQIPLSLTLANFIIWAFRIQMDSWSYFSIQYRHFIYQNPTSPASFGLKNHCDGIVDILRLNGIK